MSVGVGKPVVVSWKLPPLPARKVVPFALVICAGWSTVRVKVWTSPPIRFDAAKWSV